MGKKPRKNRKKARKKQVVEKPTSAGFFSGWSPVAKVGAAAVAVSLAAVATFFSTKDNIDYRLLLDERLCASYVNSERVGEVSYFQAQRSPDLRQAYIHQTVDRHSTDMRTASAVYYDPDGSLAHRCIQELQDRNHITPEDKESLDTHISERYNGRGAQGEDQMFTLLISTSMGRSIRHPIFVGPEAFEGSENYFLSMLKDHEIKHTDDAYQGIDLGNGTTIDFESARTISPLLLVALVETRAYLNQLESGDRRNVVFTENGPRFEREEHQQAYTGFRDWIAQAQRYERTEGAKNPAERAVLSYIRMEAGPLW